MNARPPIRLAQLRSVSHALVSTFAKTPDKSVKRDTIWQPTLQRQLGATMYGGSYVVNLFKRKFITTNILLLS